MKKLNIVALCFLLMTFTIMSPQFACAYTPKLASMAIAAPLDTLLDAQTKITIQPVTYNGARIMSGYEGAVCASLGYTRVVSVTTTRSGVQEKLANVSIDSSSPAAIYNIVDPIQYYLVLDSLVCAR